jgi:hypothetical protein
MSESSFGHLPGFREIKEQHIKNEMNQKNTNEKTRVSQIPKNDDKKGFDRDQTKEIMRSLREQESLIKNLMRNMDRRSKEVGSLQVQIARLEKYSAATDKALRETVTFIHNRGWKKKKNK